MKNYHSLSKVGKKTHLRNKLFILLENTSSFFKIVLLEIIHKLKELFMNNITSYKLASLFFRICILLGVTPKFYPF